MTELEIVNVVGSITLQQELDLSELTKTFETRPEISDVTYNPSENHWLQTRFNPDSSYVAFYRSGVCSIVGVESIDEFHDVADVVIDVMHDLLGFDYEPVREIQNIVATTTINLDTTLEIVTVKLGLEEVEYEPEQFPGVLIQKDEYTILLFSSGKLICTGLTTIEDITTAVEDIETKISEIN